jgi:hypothetical protein
MRSSRAAKVTAKFRVCGRLLGSNVLVSDWRVVYQTEDFVPTSSILRDKVGPSLTQISVLSAGLLALYLVMLAACVIGSKL